MIHNYHKYRHLFGKSCFKSCDDIIIYYDRHTRKVCRLIWRKSEKDSHSNSSGKSDPGPKRRVKASWPYYIIFIYSP